MSDRVLLGNIERLLKAKKASADAVSKAAGAPDAIRNLRRSVKGEKSSSWKIDTLDAIAAELGASSWELLRPPGAIGQDEESRELVREIVREELNAPARTQRARR